VNWWRDHVDHTINYTIAAKSKDRPGMLKAVGDLTKGAAEWGRISGRSHLGTGLMAEHIVAAKLAADSAASGDSAGLDCSLKILDRNAYLQAMVYAATWAFPIKGFHSLLLDHIDRTKQYISALSNGDRAGFADAVARALGNAKDLDGFTHRSFRR